MAEKKTPETFEEAHKMLVEAGVLEPDAELRRGLDQDKVISATREELLELLVHSAMDATGLLISALAATATIYVKRNGGKVDEVAKTALATAMAVTQLTHRTAVITARWNALHPDQKPVGDPDRMARIDALGKEGEN